MSECLVLLWRAEDVVLLALDFKIENGPESVNKDTFLDTIFKYFTNPVPSSINIDRFIINI
jgi:hypothetical protein